MTSGHRRGDADESAAMTSSRATWWLERRLRLAVLLLVLGIAVFALLTSHSNVFSPAGGNSAAASDVCVPVVAPPLRDVSLRQLEALRASLLPVMRPLSRSRYAWGIVPTAVAWTDNSPQSIRASETDGLWPASYEMRSWVTDPELTRRLDDLAADVFLFANSADAGRFFAEASAVRCHRHGTGRAAAEPPHARNLIWLNPDSAIEEDVFLLRGTSVYRIVDVRPESRSISDQQAGIARVNSLACALVDASCVPPARSADAAGLRRR
jgi:hypothetical protein